jgi:signal transduction histidine kinase
MARSEPAPASPSGAVGTQLSSLVGTARALVTDVRGILAAIGRDMAPLRERGRWGDHDAEIGEIAASVNRHIAAASEIVSDLARLAGCPLGELPTPCQVGAILREVVKAETARASRHEVSIVVDVPDELADDVLPAHTVSVLLQNLLDAAIGTSPPRSTVRVSSTETPSGVTVCFDDAGEVLSAKAKAGALARDFDALVQERTASLPLIAAFAIALQMRATLTLEDAPSGGTRAKVHFPRSIG